MTQRLRLTGKGFAAVLLSGLACGCFGPEDGPLVLEGTVVDRDGKPIEGCNLALRSDERAVSWREVKSRFSADFVIGPGTEEYYAEVVCPGHPTTYRSRTFSSTGQSDGPPVELGEIRIP